MTEVPEYLLERSRSRRQALGLLDNDGGGDDAGVGGGGGGGAGVRESSGPSPTAVAPIEPRKVSAPPPEPAHVTAARTRSKPPAWISISLVTSIAVWALVYVALLGESDAGAADPLELGAELYAANCASCHGAGGGGGVGRPLAGSEVVLTFPLLEDQFAFVRRGSVDGEPYGAESRPGGQRIGGSFGTTMPGFGERLSDAELYAIIRHEREDLSGEELDSETVQDREVTYELLQEESDTVSTVLPDAEGAESASS